MMIGAKLDGYANYGSQDAGLLYDLFLPDGISNVGSIHWGCERVAHLLNRRYDDVISCRLTAPIGPRSSEEDCTPTSTTIETRCGEPWSLPFAQASMQCLLLHNTLEEMPGNRRQKTEYRAALLRSCRSVLVHDGILMVASNNWLSADNLRDAFNNSSSNSGKEKNFGGLSLWCCHRGLRQAGFLHTESYAVIPDLDHPEVIISMLRVASSVYYERIKARTLAHRPYWSKLFIRLLGALNMRARLEPCYLILARP